MYLSGSLAILLVLELAVSEGKAFNILRVTEDTTDLQASASSPEQVKDDSNHTAASNDQRQTLFPNATTILQDRKDNNDSARNLLLKNIQATNTLETVIDIQLPANSTTSTPDGTDEKSVQDGETTTSIISETTSKTVAPVTYESPQTTLVDLQELTTEKIQDPAVTENLYVVSIAEYSQSPSAEDALKTGINNTQTSTSVGTETTSTSEASTMTSNAQTTETVVFRTEGHESTTTALVTDNSDALKSTPALTSDIPTSTQNEDDKDTTSISNTETIETETPTVVATETNSIMTTTAEQDEVTEVNNNSSYLTKTVDITNEPNDTSSTQTIHDGSSPVSESTIKTTVAEIQTSFHTDDTKETLTTEESVQLTDVMTTEPTMSIKGDTGLPYWKKYTTIDRKRPNSVPKEEKDEVLVKASSGQGKTTISLEKALSGATEIQSLQKLKDDLLATSIMDSTEKISSALPSDESNSTETLLFAETTHVLDITSTLPNVVSSKRAGFLDYSSRTTTTVETNAIMNSTPKDNTPTTLKEVITEKEETKEPNNVSSGTDQPLIKSTRNKSYINSLSSKSRMVEDAIQEELMKEKILSDIEQHAERHKEDRFGAKISETLNTEIPTNDVAEDKLSVKPISIERQKSNGLYTVSPNYKPLKKIEVQPPKPFMRNPDDNSWRNESLSSLGIVFKANNSSKPFTQVLKNKTETIWGSLLEGETGDKDQPELRERLEKIAEQRKSKKKKINQFGETVYTDYEDAGSGERAATQPTREISNYTTEAVYERPATPPAPSHAFPFERYVEPSKPKPMDEYDDDDEPEYVIPNIDLKKFKASGASTARLPPPVPHLPLPGKLPQPGALPDRRPTVQYFPPRPRTTTTRYLPDYDTEFQRKVNAFTYSSPRAAVTAQRTTPVPPRPTSRPTLTPITMPSSTTPDSGFSRAAYVIKHLRDFIEDVVKADEGVDAPLQGVTVADATPGRPPTDYYDYEAQFRRDVLAKFVDNFNQNSERFKSDFPVLYNTTVVHAAGGAHAGSSHAQLRRLLPAPAPARAKPCDRSVELSPAYELHYYVPDEEEKEELQPKPVTLLPYRFRL